MKKLLLLIAILSFNFSSAQYIPMLEEGNTWNVVFSGWGTGTDTYTYEIGDEIIINGVSYNEIITDENITSCFLREEDNKVIGYANDNTEYIIYDFNLEVGDVVDLTNGLHSCIAIGDPWALVLTVTEKSVQFIAGEDRTVIDFESDGFPVESWIEGIGSTSGFYPHGEGVDSDSSLSCFTRNGETTYFNDYTQCIILILGSEEYSKDEIILYPNPVTNRSILQLPVETSVDRIKILDIHGRIVKDEIISKEYYTIDVIDFRSGLYFYQVYSKEKVVKTKQFIVY